MASLIKIGAKVGNYGCYVTFQMAEVAVSRQMFKKILVLIVRPSIKVHGAEGRGITRYTLTKSKQ